MKDDDHPSEQENEDPQADTKSISLSDEDTDVVGSNFEYNSKDTKMVVVDQFLGDQGKHYNEVESSRPNKHIRYRSSPSMDYLEEGHVPKPPPSASKIHHDYHISETPLNRPNKPPSSLTPQNHTLVLTLTIPSQSNDEKKGGEFH